MLGMTKLLEWLLGSFVFLGIWFAMNMGDYKYTESQKTFLTFLPVIIVGFFGIYAISVILWRVLTFNDCEEAAAELQQEIQEARSDLKSKGFVFDSAS